MAFFTYFHLFHYPYFFLLKTLEKQFLGERISFQFSIQTYLTQLWSISHYGPKGVNSTPEFLTYKYFISPIAKYSFVTF